MASRIKNKKNPSLKDQINASLRSNPATKQAGYLNWEGAQFSPNRTYSFAPLYSDAKQEFDSASRFRLLSVSRQLENNFSVYKQLIDTVSNFAVGRGINPSSATSNEDYNNVANLTWFQWQNNRFCCVDQSGNFQQNLKVICERMVADGEVFVLFTKSSTGYPQIQLIDPLQVETDTSEQDSKVTDGIAYSDQGQPLSYRIKQKDKSYLTITAENCKHIFDRKRIGQGRGFPWASSAFNEMQDVKDTLNLELQGIKASAVFAGQLIDKGLGGPDEASGIFGPRTKQGQPIVNGTPTPTNQNPAEVERVTLGGKVLNLSNKEFKLIESNRPSPQFEALRKMLHRDICQSMGIPVEVAYDPEGLNNGSTNTVIESMRAFVADVQSILIESFCKPTYAWVLSSLLPLSEVRPLGNENPFVARWNPPKKFGRSRNDTMNDVLLLNNKMITLERFYHENYGEDWWPNIQQRIKEEKMINAEAQAQGVDMSKVVYGMGSVSLKETEMEDDTDQNAGKKKEPSSSQQQN